MFSHKKTDWIHWDFVEDLEAQNKNPNVAVMLTGYGEINNLDFGFSGDCRAAVTFGTKTTIGGATFSADQQQKSVYLHELGHCIGALGDNNCPSRSCIMSYNTDYITKLELIKNDVATKYFCSQCQRQIKSRLNSWN